MEFLRDVDLHILILYLLRSPYGGLFWYFICWDSCMGACLILYLLWCPCEGLVLILHHILTYYTVLVSLFTDEMDTVPWVGFGYWDSGSDMIWLRDDYLPNLAAHRGFCRGLMWRAWLIGYIVLPSLADTWPDVMSLYGQVLSVGDLMWWAVHGLDNRGV